MHKPVDEEDLRDPARAPVVRYSPDPRLTALAAGGVVVALGLAVVADAAGRLLFLVAAVVLVGYAASDLVFRPRLTVAAAGLRVRSPFGRADLAWPDVESVRADTHQRLGLRNVTLEIDAGTQLIVLTRRALGADPADVADLVQSFDPRR